MVSDFKQSNRELVHQVGHREYGRVSPPRFFFTFHRRPPNFLKTESLGGGGGNMQCAKKYRGVTRTLPLISPCGNSTNKSSESATVVDKRNWKSKQRCVEFTVQYLFVDREGSEFGVAISTDPNNSLI